MKCKINWKEYRSKFNEQATLLVSELSLEQKVSLMSGRLSIDEILGSIRKKSRTHYNEVPYLAGGTDKIPPVKFVDGSRGVVCSNGVYTCFPVASMRGATFDKELEEQVGKAIGEEVILADGNLFGGVCLNVPYHPGWGRSQEVYGEDTSHISKMGQALVSGIQSTGVIACLKHFAFNSIENIRREVDVDCDKDSEEEIFLRQFKECIYAGAGAVMTAYNKYKGEKCGQSKYLLTDLLRDEWKFDGFTLSDFTWGIDDTLDAVEAGQDIEMPNTNYYGQELIQLVTENIVSEELIDEACIRIVRTVLAHESVISETTKGIADNQKLLESHRKLAYKVALEGITLLKNNDVLPFKSKDSKSKIVVLGEIANIENTGDKGSSQVYPPYVITPLKGIIEKAGKAEVIYYNGKNISHCKRLADSATSVILVTGNTYKDEGERISADEGVSAENLIGGDRKGTLRIPKKDLEIIKAIKEIRDDIVVVLEGGSTIVVDDFIDDIGALLFCYYPGMEGGNAIADILFGNENPSGKLPFVIPHSEEDLQLMNWDDKNQFYDYYHGYKLLDRNNVTPRFGYGFGLSYTSFDVKEISREETMQGTKINVSVTNTGEIPGAEVVKLFYNDNQVQFLEDFERVELAPNETKEIHFVSQKSNLKIEY